MLEKLEEVRQRYEELNARMADPELTSNPDEYKEVAKEHAKLGEVVEVYEQYQQVGEELEEARQIFEASEGEMREMARAELEQLEQRHEQLEDEIRELLIPEDPLDKKNILLEIRAGAGGDEAALFAADLFRMYTRYGEQQGWDIDIVDYNETDQGGFKEIIALIEGERVYSHLKHEGGVHRVQRVPDTETKGRIHTSTVTVAVLPEAEDVDVQVNKNDLEIESFRSSGPGGQHANVTDSAIRITHIPSGLVVTCQDEKSQHQNRLKAMKVLKARLLEHAKQQQQQKRAQKRRGQVGTGQRSEKIRTYNFPQSRITDHRIEFTTHRLETVLEGELDYLLEPLQDHFRAEALKSIGADKDSDA